MNEREKMLIGMNEIILSLNNEYGIMSWLAGGVPDGADEEEIKWMANDDDDFFYCVSLFLDILKSYGKDGLYVDRKLITKDSRKE